jgi:hypothetical protein
MTNQFTDIMSKRTDSELEKIVTSPSGDYQPEDVEAAKSEIEKRKVTTATIENFSDREIIEYLKSKGKHLEFEIEIAKNEAKRTFVISTAGWIAAAVVIATLSFHYLPEHEIVFPKDHLTFNNTFIMQNDIDKLIHRCNNSAGFEQIHLRQDPLVQKLLEKGIIIE